MLFEKRAPALYQGAMRRVAPPKPESEPGPKPGLGGRSALRIVPIALLIAAGIIYPLVFSANKIAVESGIPPLGFVFWHSLCGGLALLLACAIRGELPRLTLPHLRLYFVMGFLGIVAPLSLLTFVAPHLPAGIVTMVVILSPTLTYLFAMLFGLDRLKALSVTGILLGLGGVLLVVVPEVSLPSREMVWWVLIALIAPACFAFANVLAAVMRPPEAPSLTLATGIMLAAVIMMTPIMLGTGQVYLFAGATTAGNLAIPWAAAINAVFYVTFFEIVRLAGPVFFSQFNYLMILAGFGWGILLFGERHSVYIWGAAALMLCGLTLLTLGTRQGMKAKAAT